GWTHHHRLAHRAYIPVPFVSRGRVRDDPVFAVRVFIRDFRCAIAGIYFYDALRRLYWHDGPHGTRGACRRPRYATRAEWRPSRGHGEFHVSNQIFLVVFT